MSSNYQQKYVIFLDILGFSKKIESENSDYILDILSVFRKEINRNNFNDIPLREIHNQGGFQYVDICFEDSKKICGDDFNCTSFSDNVVISINPNQIGSRINVIRFCQSLQFELLMKGVLTRGGLSYGDIYHESDIVFGKALVDAVAIEKKIKYPLIGIDPISCADIIRDFRDMMFIDNPEIASVNFFQSMFFCDFEGKDYNEIIRILNRELEPLIGNESQEAKKITKKLEFLKGKAFEEKRITEKHWEQVSKNN
jgi:hypothetical protein